MKRLFAILILNVFLLNVLGSYGILVGLKINASEELAKKLDSEMYDPDETVTFEVPFTVPYGTDSKIYERLDGQFEENGVVYRMVKQRLVGDTLHIVCIKDHKSSRINSALSEIAQGYAGHDDGDHKTVAQTLIKDYVNTEISITPAMNGWQSDVIRTETIRYFFDSYFASIVHPPDRLV